MNLIPWEFVQIVGKSVYIRGERKWDGVEKSVL